MTLHLCFVCIVASLPPAAPKERNVPPPPVVMDAASADKPVATNINLIMVPASFYARLDEHTRKGVRTALEHGGAMLSAEEAFSFLVSALEQRETTILQTPTLRCDVGQSAAMCMSRVSIQVTPLESSDGVTHIKLKGLINEASTGGEPITFNVDAWLHKEQQVLFRVGRGKDSPTGEERVVLILAGEKKMGL